jgi:hypothetical protein
MTKPGKAADGIAGPKLIITETPCCGQWFDMRGLPSMFMTRATSITPRSSPPQTPRKWFAENEPEGVAFEYEVLE